MFADQYWDYVPIRMIGGCGLRDQGCPQGSPHSLVGSSSWLQNIQIFALNFFSEGPRFKNFPNLEYYILSSKSDTVIHDQMHCTITERFGVPFAKYILEKISLW